MGVFKAYDVRGIYPTDINEELAYKVGKAYVEFLRAKKLLVGMDMRNSSYSLASSLMRGITEMGCDVEYLDLVTTPMTYFATEMYNADGAIMVTASHNPKEYNGLKFSREHAIPVGKDSGLQDVEALVIKNDFKLAETLGKIVRKDISKDYQRFILSHVNLKKRLKIVVDTSNGMVGHIFNSIFKGVEQLEIVELHFELDGNFPNHEANPITDSNYRDLRLVMSAINADFGVMFDGDGDRVGFIDHKGRIIPSDIITAILSDYLLTDDVVNKEVVYDVRSSRVLEEVILAKGGVPTLNKVGHAYMKKTLRDHDAFFGGELAGHFYFKEFFYADSAVFAFVKMINLLSNDFISLKDLSSKYMKYFPSGEINFRVKDAQDVLEKITQELKKDEDATLNFIDGVRADYPDYWISIRKSNTEPLLRLVVEATTSDISKKITQKYTDLIKELDK